MVDQYDRLDFEFDEPISVSSVANKKKKKLIDLDDLLADYEKEQKRLHERKTKQKKFRKAYDAEDDADEATEAQLTECVDKCQKEINQIKDDEEMPLWGIQVFGKQEKLQQPDYPELKSSFLLQSFMNHNINSMVELNIEKGENFLEGSLVDGWLLHVVRASGCVEKSIATWTFNLMLYSSNMVLVEAACQFWCAILSLNIEAESSSIKIDWLPRYSDLKKALLDYGFLLDSPKTWTDVNMANFDSDTEGPPQNIRSWIKCSAVCCQLRNASVIFSMQEVEELLTVFIYLFLDRQLLGLSIMLHNGMLSVIDFFRDEAWADCCTRVAKSLARSVPCIVNCLRVVESIAGVSSRSKQLRGAVAFQFLVKFLGEKVCDGEEILRVLISINVKDKHCDLFKMYMYLSLVENWLLFDTTLKDTDEVHELWRICLRNCSSAITITDLRSYASNVRSKASYLQGTTKSSDK